MRENDPMLPARAVPSGGTLAGELTDTEAAVRVYAAAGGLTVLGLLLLLFTIWWWRGTRPEPPALGPLEAMGDRRWVTASEPDRRRLVDDHRPAGAKPLYGTRVEPQPIDLSVLARDLPSGFDDLREAGRLDADLHAAPAPLGEALDLAGEREHDRVDADPSSADVAAAPASVTAPADPVLDPQFGDVSMIDPLLQRANSGD